MTRTKLYTVTGSLPSLLSALWHIFFYPPILENIFSLWRQNPSTHLKSTVLLSNPQSSQHLISAWWDHISMHLTHFPDSTNLLHSPSGLWEVIPLLDSLSCFLSHSASAMWTRPEHAMYGIWLHTASLRKVLSYEKKVIYILHTGVWNTCQWWRAFFQLIRPCNFKLVHRPASLASNGRWEWGSWPHLNPTESEKLCLLSEALG